MQLLSSRLTVLLLLLLLQLLQLHHAQYLLLILNSGLTSCVRLCLCLCLRLRVSLSLSKGHPLLTLLLCVLLKGLWRRLPLHLSELGHLKLLLLHLRRPGLLWRHLWGP